MANNRLVENMKNDRTKREDELYGGPPESFVGFSRSKSPQMREKTNSFARVGRLSDPSNRLNDNYNRLLYYVAQYH